MEKFINRKEELTFLEKQYNSKSSSLVILYGRRRVGKTSLIHEFIKKKPALYFLASEEAELMNMRALKELIAAYIGDTLLAQAQIDNWDILFQTLTKQITGQRLILVLDEFQYLGKTNPAFPSVFQRIWDQYLKTKNIMVILCGSLINMMESQTLNYGSPLYGRRTGQIRLQQIEFKFYHEFFPNLSYRDLIERYAVTGGVPKYIEMFDQEIDIFNEIEEHILNKRSLLFEEPIFLLKNEVTEVGSYFSIIKSIASGNHRLSKICSNMEIKQTNLPKYLKILIDLDILEREVPITETNPEKSKMGLYHIKDNYLNFWFKFVYPNKSKLELSEKKVVMQKIRTDFVTSHVAYVYEEVCKNEIWKLLNDMQINFNKVGRWWNNNEEIDLVCIDNNGNDIIFGECKYRNKPMDIDVFEALLVKKEYVLWKKDNRNEKYVLFSISGYTEQLISLAERRGDIILWKH